MVKSSNPIDSNIYPTINDVENNLSDRNGKSDKVGIDEKKDDPTKIDAISKALGSFGRWHFFVCFFLFLVKFPAAWHQMSIIFIAVDVNYWCVNVPYSDSGGIATEKCPTECSIYEFDRGTFTNTLQMTWSLVCKDQYLVNAAQLIFMCGVLVGSFVFGTLADKVGRRIPLVVAVSIQLVSGIATAFIPVFWGFCIARFVTAFATGGSMVVSFVLIMEIVGTKWRDVLTALFQFPFILGHMSLPLFAYYLRDWKDLQLAISVPSVVLISYFWVVPESPRWLFTVGRVDAAEKVLTKVAKFNKRSSETIRSDLETQQAETSTTESKSHYGFVDLVRTPNMRRNTLCMWFNWLSCGMGFYGVAQYIGQSDGDKFTNVAISAAIGIPAMVICLIGMKLVGRKWTLITSNALTGVCMLIIIAVPDQQVILASIALVGLNIAFTVVYVFVGELIPTVVRSIGVGTASVLARVGSMVAPFIISLKNINFIYPPIIFGAFTLFGAFLVFFLPETIGQPLPATIEDAEHFGKNKRKKRTGS